MTRKDFELIADTLKDCPKGLKGSGQRQDWEIVCGHFAAALNNTNPRFDRSRFLTACGIE